MGESNKLINISVSFIHLDPSDPLKTYASDKIKNTVQKFTHHDTEIHVVLKVEKNRQIAETSFSADGSTFHVKEESDDLYLSIDKMVDTLAHQLRKHKEKLTSHH